MDIDSINDVRTEFKNITFSKFQKSKAKQELINCIYHSKIENACYWSAEFICAGHYLDLWDIIILYYCKYIHYGNPKLAIYLNMRYSNFVNIVNNGYSNNLLILRNNKKIRKLFSEIICILCFSNKKQIYQEIKLSKTDGFDLINISSKFKAPNVKYIESIYKEDDPKELYIPINELIYNLLNKNIIDTCYWFEWILEYENISKKKKKKCLCEARSYAPNGFYNDIIWIIWDIIFFYSKIENINNFKNENFNKKNISSINSSLLQNQNIINKIIESLFNIFIIKYNTPCKRKRRYIIYFCFNIIIENYDYSIDIITPDEKEKVDAIINKIDTIYKEIKKNEISPNTDYLFTNLKKTNIEKTIEKIEMINNLDIIHDN
jgi:hypothetical protein